MPKEVIDGLLFDTEQAEEIGSWSNGRGASDFSHCREALYRTENGRYFIHGKGGPKSKYRKSVGQAEWSGGSGIRPVSESEAQEWASDKLKASTVMDEFGENVDPA